MSDDSNIRWKRSVAGGNRIGYILERFSHNHATGPIWVPVTMQNEEGYDTDTTLFVGTGEIANLPTIKTGPENIFEVTLDSVENLEDVVDD